MKIRNMSARAGFTLIELLVVIAIIGILSGVIMANFTTARQRSRDAKRVSDISQIQLALEQFFDKCNYYPVQLGIGATCTSPTGQSYTLGNFISVIPTPPTGSLAGSYYYAALNSPCTSYHLGAPLEYNDANGVLKDDLDGAGNGSACTDQSGGVSAADFSGADQPNNVYDVGP